MNVFVPYQSPLDCAKSLWNDSKRYNKQCIEIEQIQQAILGSKSWRNHPVTKMYENHYDWLLYYKETFIAYKKFRDSKSLMDAGLNYEQATIWSKRADEVAPAFLENQDLLDAHKRRLYTKSPEKYPQFAEYGTSEENWYVMDGKIIKYVNGKRIN